MTILIKTVFHFNAASVKISAAHNHGLLLFCGCLGTRPLPSRRKRCRFRRRKCCRTGESSGLQRCLSRQPAEMQPGYALLTSKHSAVTVMCYVTVKRNSSLSEVIAINLLTFSFRIRGQHNAIRNLTKLVLFRCLNSRHNNIETGLPRYING